MGDVSRFYAPSQIYRLVQVRGVTFVGRLTWRSGKRAADSRKLTDRSSLTLCCRRALCREHSSIRSLLAKHRWNESPRLKADTTDEGNFARGMESGEESVKMRSWIYRLTGIDGLRRRRDRDRPP